jgi:hypothetical protein
MSRNRVCVKKAATAKGYTVFSGETFISHTTGTDKKWFFYDSGEWKELKNGSTTVEKRGKWTCNGPDNYFVWWENQQYSSSSNNWARLNTIFNCVKEELESRYMKYEFTSNELKLLFPRDKQHWSFYEDGKWGKFNTEDNSPVMIDGKPTVGTWECDGEEEYKVLTEWGIYNSKLNSWT